MSDFKPGLEGVIAFETEIAEPDKEGGALRYRGVDIEELVGHVSYGHVWGLLVDNAFAPGLPPAEPYPIPVHGGAPARVLGMIEEVERTGDAEGYVASVLDRGERLMGFGHRVYRAEDPRARVLRRTAKELGAPRYEVALALEKAALAELRARRPDRGLETNVEFWAAIVLDFAEVPSRATGRAGGIGRRLPGHVAPAAAGPVAGTADPGRPGRTLRPPGRLHGRPRQRRHQRVLGDGHVRADPRALPAPELRRVLGQVRGAGRPRAVAVRADRDRVRPRQPPGADGGPAGGHLRADAQRDLDRRGDAGAPGPRRQTRVAGRGRRDQRRGRASGAGRRVRRVLLRPAEGPGFGRRPVDRADVTGRGGASARDRGERAVRARLPLAADRAGELGQGADLQHARGGGLVPAGRPDRVDARPGRPGLDHGADRAVGCHTVYVGGEGGLCGPVRRRSRAAFAGRGHD